MLEKINQAMQMWKDGNTHGEIKKVTGLAHEQEYAATEVASKHNLSAKHVFSRLPQIKDGMTAAEIEAALTKSG